MILIDSRPKKPFEKHTHALYEILTALFIVYRENSL